MWLVAGMSSYLINLPEISDRYNAFDIAYNLLERNRIIQKVESLSPQFSTEDQMKKIASADLLIHVLTNDPERSEYFRQSLPKEIRTNFFFITDISKTSISDINADDNGAYLKSRNTNKFFYCDNDRTSIVREDISGKFNYNERLSRNSYKKVYIPSDKIVKLIRTYTKAKRFPLTRTLSKYQIQQVAFLVSLLWFSTKLQELLKKAKYHATKMPPKILNHILGRPKMFCKKLEKNV